MLPLVSVVMPAYNAEKYISQAIESILNQTYERIELVIVEDCSIDDTLTEILKFSDSRITLLRNEENKGIAYSTNRAIAVSKGKYIALMDDDDIAVTDRCKLQVDFLEKHEDIDILGGRCNDIDEYGNIIKYGVIPRYNPKYIKAVLLFNCLNFRNGTTMIRRSFIDKYNLKYQEDYQGMQDYKFFVDSSKIGNISSIGDLLLLYRVHGANETKRRKEDYKNERKQKYEEIQEYSLKASGYNMYEKQMYIIHKALAETDGKCDDKEELQLLYETFQEIIGQARKMDADYCTELELVCKDKLLRQIEKMIRF